MQPKCRHQILKGTGRRLWTIPGNGLRQQSTRSFPWKPRMDIRWLQRNSLQIPMGKLFWEQKKRPGVHLLLGTFQQKIGLREPKMLLLERGATSGY